MKKIAKIVLVTLIIGIAAVAGIAWLVLSRGFSARDRPGAIEEFLARRARSLATPGDARTATNPVAASPEVLAEAMAHFADHCAICHANDGSGVTDIGQGLYPKPPDMREADTQNLTDGEVFYIIRNGIRFTGMPAFGQDGAGVDEDSWKLVHFIRHLPRITAEELEEMKKYNPRNPVELQEEQELERFLRGEDVAPTPHKH